MMTIKIVIFDVDGTIMRTFSWQYIHRNLGTWKQARKHHNQFFRNKITYEEWARSDAALWKSQPVTRIKKIVDQMPYTRGAKETISILKQRGIKTYLLSAGLSHAAERIQKETHVDGYIANNLVTRNGLLTGEVDVNVSFYSKDEHLHHILRKFNSTIKECAAIGDDSSLIPLFRKVALSIAFNPTNKEIEKHAKITIKSSNLQDILPHILPSTNV